jgi:tRNA U38,U39,U40 pseudouridine synthase TruA
MHWEYCKNCPHKKVHVWEVIHVHKTFHAREKVHVQKRVHGMEVNHGHKKFHAREEIYVHKRVHVLSLFGHVCIEFISPMYEIACEI